jgi:integrase
LLTHSFARLIRSSGLPRVRLHDLRHGHATHLLAANTHVKVVSERLGHATIQLTLDTTPTSCHRCRTMRRPPSTTRSERR